MEDSFPVASVPSRADNHESQAMETVMSLDKTLSLSSAKRPQTVDRRSRVVERINEQIAIVNAMVAGEPVSRAPKSRMKWWWSDGSRYFAACYYARNPLELAKGKFSVQCVDLASVAHALTAIAKAIDEGAFDDQMNPAPRCKGSSRRQRR